MPKIIAFSDRITLFLFHVIEHHWTWKRYNML